MIDTLFIWFSISFGVTAAWVGAVVLLSGLPCLRRWTEPNPDPEVEVLDALEEIWRMS